MRTFGISFAALLSGAFAADVDVAGVADGEHATPQLAVSANICKSGVLQSPIDLHPCMVTIDQGDGDEQFNIPLERPKLKLNYGSSGAELKKHCEADGCSLHITPKSAFATSNMLEVPGKGSYALDKCVIRMPSEHTVNHNRYPLEVQCHHTMEHTDHGRRGILSVLYEVNGQASPFIGQFMTTMPADDTAPSTLKVADFGVIGGAGPSRYHTYSGSQTTGDCKEDADWIVMYDPTGINQAQLDTLTKSMSFNAAGWKPARNIQRHFGRHPEACHHPHVEEGSAGSATLGALSMTLVMLSLLSRA